MSKNILTKGLLVLVIITLSAALLTGCSFLSKTATVNLSGDTTALAKTYTITVDDGGSEGTITGTETLDITGLSIGSHTFKATATGYSGEKKSFISGLYSIDVTIPVAVTTE